MAPALAADPAWAHDLAVSVTARDGKPVADAVVMVRPLAGVPRAPIKFSWAYEVAQRDLKFSPYVLIVPVGAEVSFPNFDGVKHTVYSYSEAKTFRLKLYGRDMTRVVRLDKPGVVPLGCDIHDTMLAYIRVVDTPYAAKTLAGGAAVIRDLPPGPATVTVWHPDSRTANGESVRRIVVPASGAASLALQMDVRPAPMHMN
ncbi:methylamine utilization protein [Phenylobacterium sp.]|uniref:methylamine utilization protein n=1 Tax=Phenylobacterium sp. TaxID=1871053 RepID=UPI002CC442BC|nr:methylamine utilization protein [Phenylobacterium sp.]HLZ74098.1 methylamine utilization protein [Phenylobacterium sp.]